MNTAEIEPQKNEPSFVVTYVKRCPWCGLSSAPILTGVIEDHHCPGSDIIVNQLRNQLDDQRQAEGRGAKKYCKHDNVKRRRAQHSIRSGGINEPGF